MRVAALSAAQIVDLADAGREAAVPERGLLLLAAAGVEDGGASAQDLGDRHERLLALRCATLGEELKGHLRCPICVTQLALRLTGASLTRERPARRTVSVEVDGWSVEAAGPDGEALAAAAGCVGVAAARATLIERCVLSARRDGVEVGAGELPDAVVAAVGEALVANDPALDVRIRLTCAACGHEWRCCFDATTFLWLEVEALAGRILDEVHTLATGYGWTEDAVLRLSSRRRRQYVERLGVA